MTSNYLTVTVSGKKFTLTAEALKLYPDTKLGKFINSNENIKMECSFERPVRFFKEIHAFYQTGKLHMPTNACPQAFLEELNFWEIEVSYMESCCLSSLESALGKLKKFKNFVDDLREHNQVKVAPKELSRKQWIWGVLENQFRTKAAKVYLAVSISLIIISVLSLSISTLPVFGQRINVCEMKSKIPDADDYLNSFLDNLDCDTDPWKVWHYYFGDIPSDLNEKDFEEYFLNHTHYQHPEEYDDYYSNYINGGLPLDTIYRHYKTRVPQKVKKHVVFTVINQVVMIFFAIELIMRLLTCPNFRKYFLSFLNILDILIITASIAVEIVESVLKETKFDKRVEALDFLQFLRIFRLLRVVQHIVEVRVFVYCVKTNIRDLLVLLVFVLTAILIFSSVLYFAEGQDNVDSIPNAWYWSVVTLTTLGYGDIVPKSVGGKLIGGICALAGIFVFAMIIPVFVNNYKNLNQLLHSKKVINQKKWNWTVNSVRKDYVDQKNSSSKQRGY
ncbi:potassium voltage-gated channel subfamily B member 2-like [Saccostrea echinata]|uniref:potassium voltage-gated channel subfamily B member 2-like n=1 Tax=Saccostrea echinata TaxID=191078 RepID=UPI002A8225BC|nr:potassium voltage-gated channel subfamily B member 2-like [Saccostrea echinata]